MTFQELGLNEPILRALADQGYEQPSPIQAKAIPPALTGRDVLGCAQTGTGKTCAFAAPILQQLSGRKAQGRPIRALILTPTRELALQIQESFEAYGKYLPLRSTVIFGGVGQAPQVERLKKGVDILVATPGRLGDLYGQKLIDLSRLEIFVLDEADRMLDMGFIHDVRRILGWLPAQKQTLFFSATMPPEVQGLVDSLLHNPAKVAVNPISSPVEVIDQKLYYVDRGNKTRLLAALIRELDVKNALVFTRTKHGANKVAGDLVKAGISAAAIHGNKSQTARQQALADFKGGAVQVLVATDIAARGLDIEELSHVFNYNLPEVPETYVHRIGRTGRAGHGGTAVAFCDFSEKPLLKEIEKLIGRSIPVVEDHPYPMVDLQAPKRDKNGRIINEEDAQARAAAKEQRRARDEARKAAAQRKAEAAQAAPQPVAETPVQTQEEKPAKSRRRRRKAKAKPKQAEQVQAAPVSQVSEPEPQVQQTSRRRKLTRPGSRMETGNAMPRTDFSRPNPLAGDHIMDATARLLAPRKPLSVQESPLSHRSAPRSRRKERRGEKEPRVETVQTKDKGKVKAVPSAPKKKEEPVSGKKKNSRPDRRRDRGPRGPIEPMRSNRVKDSTEQKSLMKPYYLDN